MFQLRNDVKRIAQFWQDTIKWNVMELLPYSSSLLPFMVVSFSITTANGTTSSLFFRQQNMSLVNKESYGFKERRGNGRKSQVFRTSGNLQEQNGYFQVRRYLLPWKRLLWPLTAQTRCGLMVYHRLLKCYVLLLTETSCWNFFFHLALICDVEILGRCNVFQVYLGEWIGSLKYDNV